MIIGQRQPPRRDFAHRMAIDSMKDPSVHWDILQPKRWYVLRDGRLSEPMSESQICAFVFENELTDDVKIRQGESEFFPASRIRDLFATLRNQGWYVRDAGQTYGPYVGDKLMTLIASGFFDPQSIQVRKGPEGQWVTFDEAKRSFRRRSGKSRGRRSRRSSSRSSESNPTIRQAHVDTAVSMDATHAVDGAHSSDAERSERLAGRWRASETDPQPAPRQRPEQNSSTRICSACGQEHQALTLMCDACTDKKKKQDAELAKHKQRMLSQEASTTENPQAKLLMLIAAFSASGFFLSKWLVTSVVWKDYFTRDQQIICWVYFALGVTLLIVGVLAILLDPHRKGDRRLIIASSLALLLVAGPVFLFQSSRLSSQSQQAEDQHGAWTEFMVNGGYSEPEP
jgi:hypothetical protein